jgi:hypothetical protein
MKSPSGNDAPTPDTMSRDALHATIARLREDLAEAQRHGAQHARTREQAAAMRNAEVASLTAQRDAALARLQQVRQALIDALGGEGSYPPHASEVDMVAALAGDLIYARRTAARAHTRRRVNEAMTERLVDALGRADDELAALRAHVPSPRSELQIAR